MHWPFFALNALFGARTSMKRPCARSGDGAGGPRLDGQAIPEHSSEAQCFELLAVKTYVHNGLNEWPAHQLREQCVAKRGGCHGSRCHLRFCLPERLIGESRTCEDNPWAFMISHFIQRELLRLCIVLWNVWISEEDIMGSPQTFALSESRIARCIKEQANDRAPKEERASCVGESLQ